MIPVRTAQTVVLAAAMALCGAASARGEYYTVTKLIAPTIAETQYIGKYDADLEACFPVACSWGGFVPHPETPFFPDVVVGWRYFFDPGTDPCNCVEFHAYAHRASVLFRTQDIPQCDQCGILTATLILESQGVQQKGNVLQDLIAGIFEVTPGPAPTFDDASAVVSTFLRTLEGDLLLPGPGQLVRYSPNDGHIVMTRFVSGEEWITQEKNPVLDPFPFRPGPRDFPVSKTPGFNYRIDVTSAVKNWIANLPNTPSLNGFVIAGLDESLPKDQNSTLLVEYFIRLEVVYHEPVL